MTRHLPTLAALLLLAACGGEGRRLEPAGGERATGTPATGGSTAEASGSGPAGQQPPATAGGPAAENGPAMADAAPAAGPQLPPPMDEILAAHNRLRAQHCAPPLEWSEALAEDAQSWADGMAARGCTLQHSDLPHGENLYMATSGVSSPAGVAESWYSEVRGYHFRRGGFSMRTGHFTQLVWASTRSLGCGRSSCNGLDVWVCMYDPPGNVQGGYRDNVKPTSCD